MAEKNIALGEAFGFGWKTTIKNFGFFFGLMVILFLIKFILHFFSKALIPSVPGAAGLVALAGWVIQIVVSIGLIKIALSFCDNEKARYADLFNYSRLFFRYLFASILYCLAMMVGLVLLVIPGIIWAIQFSFFPYFIVEKGADAMQSLRKSSELTKGVKWELFFLGILLILFNMAGAICLVIGLLVTLPASMLIHAWVYRKLLAQTQV